MASSIGSRRDASLRIRLAPDDVTLDDWGLRDRPLGSSLALTLAAGMGWLAVWSTGSVLAGGIVAAALALTLWRSWIPVRYRLSSAGVSQSVFGRQRHLAWSAIRDCDVRGDGILLHTAAASTSLAPLFGLYLYWGSQQNAVLAHVEYHLEAIAPRSGPNEAEPASAKTAD